MSLRLSYFIGFIFTCALLAYGFYLQMFEGFIPCPLCTLQRICFALVGIFMLFCGVFYRQRIIFYFMNTLAGVSSILGLFFSGRQIWLQHFPTTSNGECGVSLQYMLQALPINEVAFKVFSGSAECSKRGWVFLTFTMAEWSLICFLIFAVFIAYSFKKSRSH